MSKLKYTDEYMIGKKFNMLTVVSLASIRKNGKRSYNCKCDCGSEVIVIGADLRSLKVTSCGCLALLSSKQKMQELIDKGIINNTRKAILVDGTNLSLLNIKRSINNKSGRAGVCWNKRLNKWRASITFKRQYYHLGTFSDFEDAVKAREKAEELLWTPIFEKYLGKIEFDNETDKQKQIHEYIRKCLLNNTEGNQSE